MSLAFALDFSEVETDPSMLDGTTKDCPACDEDNPRAVARAECVECAGSGRVGLAAGEIAKELKASKSGKDNGDHGRGSDDDDGLYLEY